MIRQLLPFVFLIAVGSCADRTPSTVFSESSDNALLADASASRPLVAIEDTSKPVKVVYVALRRGLELRKDSNDRIPVDFAEFASPLHVVKEYRNWYKVKKQRNGQWNEYYAPKTGISFELPIGTRLLYPAFTLEIMKFVNTGGEGMEEESENGWRVYKDTIFIIEGIDGNISGDLMRILPGNPNDRFKVSYAHMYFLSEVTDVSQLIEDETVENPMPFFVHEIMPYKPLKISDKGFYVIPGYPNTKEKSSHEALMQKKYKLRDTVLQEPHDFGKDVLFTKNNKLYIPSFSHLMLRIERVSKGKVKETKYLLIEFSYGC